MKLKVYRLNGRGSDAGTLMLVAANSSEQASELAIAEVKRRDPILQRPFEVSNLEEVQTLVSSVEKPTVLVYFQPDI